MDAASVRFGDKDQVWTLMAGAPPRHGHAPHEEDSFELDETTKDGDLDGVLHFRSAQTGLSTTSTEACARGLFDDGGNALWFFGCDGVRIVPP